MQAGIFSATLDLPVFGDDIPLPEQMDKGERKMENNHNSKERQKEVQRLTLVVLGIMTAVIIGYTAYGLATDKMNMLLFGLLLGGFVILYLVMSDIVEPYRLGLLRELTQEKRSAFLKILLMDLIGGGALIYWIAGLGSETGSDILIPFLIYFLTAQLKRKYRAEFDGTAAEEAAGGEEADEEISDEEVSDEEISGGETADEEEE